MKPKIIILNSSTFGVACPELITQLEEFATVVRASVNAHAIPQEIIAVVSDASGLVLGVNPYITEEVLNGLPTLKIIARHGIGYNNVSIPASENRGIMVTNVPGIIERNAVAEHAIALLLSAARHISQGANAVHSGQWSRRGEMVGVELSGKTVGVIGCGNIGSRVCEILARGFGCTVLVYDPEKTSTEIESFGGTVSSLENLLIDSVAISLHAPLTEATYHLVGSQQFAQMRSGVILVNTARGELIEPTALLSALGSHKLACYAADVVEGEPIASSHPLLEHPNALIVPHLGGYTAESLRGMGKAVVENLRAVFVHNRKPKNLVTRV